MMRPAAAPAPISTGSGTLKRQMMPRATRPMSRVGTSTMARRASTKQAPAMAPDAAAVTPPTNAFTWGFSLNRSNQGNGMTTNR